jgi:LmbE family N-acetylglucosaminyl deacetylase
MLKKLSFILLILLLLDKPVFSESVSPPVKAPEINSVEPIKKKDRILILAPHPDDETIGCAGIIQQALAAGAQVKVVYLTNGDHNQFAFIVYEKRLTLRKGEFIHMGEVRRKEAIAAMKLLGLSEENLIFLGYPDFGTFTIFSQYWQGKKPFRDLLTRISSVPYKQNLSFGAPYNGESILNDLKRVLVAYKPNKIFVSHPADTNGDHRAFYLFLEVALRDLSKKIATPKIYPYLIHCATWPLPRYYHPELSLQPPRQFLNSEINWSEFRLTPEQLEKKHRAILCYKSQTQSSAFYLLSFGRKNELFGDYPRIWIDKESSAKERAVSFFGFSNMFADSDVGVLGGLENLKEDKGRVSYSVVDDSFLIRIEKTKNLNRRFSVLVYIFGYNYKTPFAEMPKIRIITKYKRFKVFEERKIIETSGVSTVLKSNVLILKVPLQLLGKPEFLLTSIKVYGGALPVDVTAFRKIDIK